MLTSSKRNVIEVLGLSFLLSAFCPGIGLSQDALRDVPPAASPSIEQYQLVRPLTDIEFALIDTAAREAILKSPLRSSTVVGIHHVALDTKTVSAIINSPPSFTVPKLSFTVSTGKPPITVVTSSLKRDKSDSVTWVGTVEGDPNSSVLFIVNKQTNALFGEIRTGGIVYEVKPSSNAPNAITIFAVDPSRFPNEHGSSDITRHNDSAPLAFPGQQPTEAVLTKSTVIDGNISAARAIQVGLPPVIDLMILYTDQAIALDAVNIAGEVCLAKERLQEHFDNSGVPATARLVHHGRVAFAEDPNGILENSLKDPGSLPQRGNTAGDPIFELRKLHAADIVSLWVSKGKDSCGQSVTALYPPSPNLENMAFSVIVRECANSNDSFVHEAGHILGADHDRFTIKHNANTNANHGYIKPDKNWKTVMAYDNDDCPLVTSMDLTGKTTTKHSCERLRYWSNLQKWNGDDMGKPVGTSLNPMGDCTTPSPCEGPADNADILKSSVAVVSGFRPLPGGPAGVLGNTSCVAGVDSGPPLPPQNLSVR
jgi:hypothetical protein